MDRLVWMCLRNSDASPRLTPFPRTHTHVDRSLTAQNYKELGQLYEKYKSQGLEILAFPCNQFGGGCVSDPRAIAVWV